MASPTPIISASDRAPAIASPSTHPNIRSSVDCKERLDAFVDVFPFESGGVFLCDMGSAFGSGDYKNAGRQNAHWLQGDQKRLLLATADTIENRKYLCRTRGLLIALK